MEYVNGGKMFYCNECGERCHEDMEVLDYLCRHCYHEKLAKEAREKLGMEIGCALLGGQERADIEALPLSVRAGNPVAARKSGRA